jgi:toxin ParE1/3/4
MRNRLQVLLTPQAEADLLSAQAWYLGEDESLGPRFSNAIENTLNRIATYPESYPELEFGIRRALTRRFPFMIYYRLDLELAAVIVIAVLHTRRQSQIWKKRAGRYFG